MTTNLIQPSLSAGELSPTLFARVDLAKYKVGLARERNFFVDYRGGASSRPGTRYIATSATPGTGLPPRIIRFQFSTLQTYVIEFGAGYIGFYTNGAQIMNGGSPYTISSPYALADLPLLKFTQSADVLTLTHPAYATMFLERLGETNWQLVAVSFTSQQAPPTAGAATATHGTETAPVGDQTQTVYTYAVTAVNATTGEESLPSVTFSATGSRIMSADGNAFVTLTWTAPVGPAPSLYNIYRQEEVPNGAAPGGSLLGLIGSSIGASYVDRNGQPDYTISPPGGANPFASGNNPGCTSYYLQRQFYAASTSGPETFWASRPGAFTNFNVSVPVQDDDAITATIASTQVNAIKSLVPMPSGLIILSSGGAWLVSGGGVGIGGIPTAIGPSSVVAQPQAFNGASDVPPITVNYDVLFVQAKQSKVRDLSYNFYVNIYTGTDLTVLSNHLFAGRAIREWAYAEEPFYLVWCIRDDGILLSLTYLKEQDVYGWARHDTNGLFQSVASVTEGQVDATYFVVKRFIGGAWQYLIERLADRLDWAPNDALGIPANIEAAWCLDCALALPQPAPAADLFPVAPAGTAGATGVVFNADAAVFSAGNVGSLIRGNGGKATITAYISATQVQATIVLPFAVLPNDPNATPIPITNGNWTMTAPVSSVGNLAYLNGMTVGILADGNVMAQQVVSAGAVTLEVPASSVLVGLPFQGQIQTLYIDAGEPTIQGKRKKVNAVTVRVDQTRGIKAGRTWQTLVPVKAWNSTVPMGGPLPLITGDQRIVLDPVYDTGGQICLQVDDPVPATVLGVIPEVSVGDS